ncbi:MAG: aminotransferase class V-fold PLP-dependent enzyme [Anaerococcus vaginalis]|nr:aminotransferase class V-fold PLP-dependent enzyme [Anaerococcus vaginalis]
MLNEKLDLYIKEDYYPFAMPGHKRNKKFLNKKISYDRDITEIRDFDNLNNPKSLFKNMEKKLAKIYDANDFIISTNGSTCGILATLRALTKNNKKILVQRNSHKSVFNAIEVFDLDPDYIKVKIDENDMAYDIDYEDIKKKIEKNSYSLIFITSPSYEGYMIDLKKIQKIIGDKNIFLLLDMAHGSHTILSDYKNNFSYDLAITSFHKNLSALTPSSGIIIKNKNIDKKEIRRNMAIFQTSSPSYIISGSIDDMVEKFPNFFDLWNDLVKNLNSLYQTKLKNLKFINSKNKDISKILISCKNTNINGNDLADLLYKEKIEIEMASATYVILISSIFDTKEGFERLKNALIKIDKKIKYKKSDFSFEFVECQKKYSISESFSKENHLEKIEKSQGKISAAYVYAYPPGIPLLIPGEIINQKIIDQIKYLDSMGFDLSLNDFSIPLIN